MSKLGCEWGLEELISFISSLLQKAKAEGYEQARSENCGSVRLAFNHGKNEARAEVVEEYSKELIEGLEEVAQYQNEQCKTLVNKADLKVIINLLKEKYKK